MIFGLWFIFWVCTVTTALCLVIPCIALCVRSSYLHRPIFPGHRIIILAFFLYIIVDITMDTEKALLFAIRASLILLFLKHILYVIENSAQGIWIFFGYFASNYQLCIRAMRSLREILDDVSYAAKVRRSGDNKGWRNIPKYLWDDAQSIGVALSEVVGLARSYDDVITARGHFPNPKLWKTPAKVQNLFYWGDFFLLVLIGILSTNLGVQLVPAWIVSFLKNLSYV